MLKSILATAAVAALTAASAHAQDGTPQRKVTAQQQRMSACSKQAKAKSLKGAERRSFMSECLRGKNPS